MRRNHKWGNTTKAVFRRNLALTISKAKSCRVGEARRRAVLQMQRENGDPSFRVILFLYHFCVKPRQRPSGSQAPVASASGQAANAATTTGGLMPSNCPSGGAQTGEMPTKRSKGSGITPGTPKNVCDTVSYTIIDLKVKAAVASHVP